MLLKQQYILWIVHVKMCKLYLSICTIPLLYPSVCVPVILYGRSPTALAEAMLEDTKCSFLVRYREACGPNGMLMKMQMRAGVKPAYSCLCRWVYTVLFIFEFCEVALCILMRDLYRLTN